MAEKEPNPRNTEDPELLINISKAVRLLIVLAIATSSGYRIYDEVKDKEPQDILQALLQPQE